MIGLARLEQRRLHPGDIRGELLQPVVRARDLGLRRRLALGTALDSPLGILELPAERVDGGAGLGQAAVGAGLRLQRLLPA